jgi:hypothetical protein
MTAELGGAEFRKFSPQTFAAVIGERESFRALFSV